MISETYARFNDDLKHAICNRTDRACTCGLSEIYKNSLKSACMGVEMIICMWCYVCVGSDSSHWAGQNDAWFEFVFNVVVVIGCTVQYAQQRKPNRHQLKWCCSRRWTSLGLILSYLKPEFGFLFRVLLLHWNVDWTSNLNEAVFFALLPARAKLRPIGARFKSLANPASKTRLLSCKKLEGLWSGLWPDGRWIKSTTSLPQWSQLLQGLAGQLDCWLATGCLAQFVALL